MLNDNMNKLFIRYICRRIKNFSFYSMMSFFKIAIELKSLAMLNFILHLPRDGAVVSSLGS